MTNGEFTQIDAPTIELAVDASFDEPGVIYVVGRTMAGKRAVFKCRVPQSWTAEMAPRVLCAVLDTAAHIPPKKSQRDDSTR